MLTPIVLVPLADFCLCDPFQFFPAHLCAPSLLLVLQHTMLSAQVRCRGCDKAFTPHGLSHHASKTQNARCRPISNPPLDNWGSPSILCAASRSASPPNYMPEVISDDQPGNESRLTTNQESEDVPELGEVSSSGATSTTCVPNSGDIFSLCIEI